MDNVREELDRLIQRRGDTYSGVSRLLGRNPAYIQQFITRGSPRKLDPDDCRILASYYGVDEQTLGGSPPPVHRGLVAIPVLDVDASAGYGAIANSEDCRTSFGFDERWLRKLTSAKGNSLSIVRVTGDSMEPTLSHGDEVLVDASDNGSRLREGVYVIRIDDTLVVKRIALQPAGKNVTIASDNEAYPNWNDVGKNSLHVIGRVIWFGRVI